MDFHSESNRHSYTSRTADPQWMNLIKTLLPIKEGFTAADIGCGGGIYSKALAEIGALTVTGVDFSREMLEGARNHCLDYPNIEFQHGTAQSTGLEESRFEVILERALIHHIKQLDKCFQEAFRLLKDDGIFIIQDRTPEDCTLKGSDTHIRGYFFEKFPQLGEQEANRRHPHETVVQSLKKAGFRDIVTCRFWETRKVYSDKSLLLQDLSGRIGRSILHELTDKELLQLTAYIDKQVTRTTDIVEQDRWTIWKAVK